MKLIIMRHGNAVDPSVDLECPLSDSGRADVQRLVKFFEKNSEIRVEKMYHSEKLRAKQTADIIASTVLEVGKPEQISGLNPSDSVAAMVDEINTWNKDTWLVGHLPFIPALVSQLLLGNKGASLPIVFQTASVVCLEQDPSTSGLWTLNWFIRPHLLS